MIPLLKENISIGIFSFSHRAAPPLVDLLALLSSLDNTTWFELPQVSPSDLAAVEKIQGKLVGDPAAEHEIPKDGMCLTLRVAGEITRFFPPLP